MIALINSIQTQCVCLLCICIEGCTIASNYAVHINHIRKKNRLHSSCSLFTRYIYQLSFKHAVVDCFFSLSLSSIYVVERACACVHECNNVNISINRCKRYMKRAHKIRLIFSFLLRFTFSELIGWLVERQLKHCSCEKKTKVFNELYRFT